MLHRAHRRAFLHTHCYWTPHDSDWLGSSSLHCPLLLGVPSLILECDKGREKPFKSILSTFLHWVLFFTKYLFWESCCQVSVFLSCMSGPVSISQSTKRLCLFNERQAEPKNWPAVPENLDFIPSIHCSSSLSLSDVCLEGKQLHKEVKFFLPSPKQLGALGECHIWSVSSLLGKMNSLTYRPAKHAAFCYIPITARWRKAGQCLIGRLSKCKGVFQFEKLIVGKGWRGEALGRCFSHKL